MAFSQVQHSESPSFIATNLVQFLTQNPGFGRESPKGWIAQAVDTLVHIELEASGPSPLFFGAFSTIVQKFPVSL